MGSAIAQGMVFRGAEPPILLHQGYNDQLETALFPDYVRELYVLDPFYLFSQSFTGSAAPGGRAISAGRGRP